MIPHLFDISYVRASIWKSILTSQSDNSRVSRLSPRSFSWQNKADLINIQSVATTSRWLSPLTIVDSTMIFWRLLILCYSLSFSQAATVCYGKYGCFSDNPPFDSSLIALPSHPESIGTKFILRTRANALQKEEILSTDDNSSLINSTFDSLRKVKFIIHGFIQNGHSKWVKDMALVLLKKEPMNIIVVDWGQGSSALNLYDAAAGNTRLVGVQVADLIDVLNQKFHVALKKFHIIGHSLGAQIAGFAGEKLRKGGKAIGRITGLDPAAPGFDFDHAAARLDPTDAIFVDVIHTDVRNGALDNSLGLQRPCGHVDFYPNGGKEQPGCGTSNVIEDAVNSFLDSAQVSLSQTVACNHMKSVAYFTASINSACAMTAFPCGNWRDFQEGKCLSCEGACPQMGYNADRYRSNKSMVAFLTTEVQQPFCVDDNYYSITLLLKDRTERFIFGIFNNKIKVKLTGSSATVETDGARDVKFGKESLVLSSARGIGKLQSIEVQFKGSGLYLKEVIVYSKAEEKRYKACFNDHLGSFLTYITFSSYTRELVEGTRQC